MNQLQDGASNLPGEREAFEAWYSQRHPKPVHDNPTWAHASKIDDLEVWQARAAISATPAAPEPAKWEERTYWDEGEDGQKWGAWYPCQKPTDVQLQRAKNLGIKREYRETPVARIPIDPVGRFAIHAPLPEDAVARNVSMVPIFEDDTFQEYGRRVAKAILALAGTQSPPAAPAVGGVLTAERIMFEVALYGQAVSLEDFVEAQRIYGELSAALSAQAPAPEVAPVRAVEQQPANEVTVCEGVRDRLWADDTKHQQAAGADACVVALRNYYRVAPAQATQGAAEADSMPCEDCNGTGEVGDEIYQGEFQPPERERCGSCDGSGRWSREAAAVEPAKVQAKLDDMAVYRAACDVRGWANTLGTVLENKGALLKSIDRLRAMVATPAPEAAQATPAAVHLHYDAQFGTVEPEAPSAEYARGWNAAIGLNPTWKPLAASQPSGGEKQA